MTVTTSSSGWRSGPSLAAIGLFVLGLAGCDGGGVGLLDVDPRRADCFSSTRQAVDIAPLPGGGAWVATGGGLLRLDEEGTTLRAYTRRDGLPANDLRGLALAPDGELWVATSRGVARLRDGGFTSYTERHGLNDEHALAVEVDGDGIVYAGTERGVSRFDGARFVPLNDTHEFSRRATYAIHAAGDGTLWLAKENALTRHLGGEEWEVFQRDPLLPGPRARIVSNTVRAVATDAQHRPWIGTHEGLGYLDEEGWRQVVFPERLFAGRGPRDNRIATLAIDSEGWIWVGHGDTRDFEGGVGVARFRDDDWRYFTAADGLPDNRVGRIRAARDGSVWLATANGAARFRDGRFEGFAEPGGLPANRVSAIVDLGDGAVEVRTAAGHVLFQRGEAVQLRPAPIDGPSDPRSVAPSDTTPAIPSTVSGAAREAWAGFRGRNAAPPRVALQDSRGRLWIGTRDEGVWRRDDAGWVELRLGGQRLPIEITALQFENADTLWVGSVSEGAMRIDLSGAGS